mgnify:CR=1 FL=1
MEDNLHRYLLSFGKISEEKVNDLMQKSIKNGYKLSEKFKEKDNLGWPKLMNKYINIAEEVVLNDYIYE